MSYATGNYGSIEDSINNPNTGSSLMDDYQRNNLRKYKSGNTSQPSRRNRNDDAYQTRAFEQAKNQAAFDSQARDAAVDRQGRIDAQALDTSQKRDDQLFRSEFNSRNLIENIDLRKLGAESTQGLTKDRQSQNAELERLRASADAQAALADKTNKANLNLASVSASTERAGQASAVERARLAANAQVRAALYAPRSYQGY
jgi:hypothetical protein